MLLRSDSLGKSKLIKENYVDSNKRTLCYVGSITLLQL